MAKPRIEVYSRWRDGCGDDQRQHDGAGDQQDERRCGRSGAATRSTGAARGSAGPSAANEKVWVSPRRLPALPVHGDRHGEEHEEVDEPGLVEVVEADQRLDDTDDDAGEEGPRERHHARDHGGGQRPGQACWARGCRGSGPSPAAPASSDSDSVARPPAMAHTSGRHRLRADAGEAGEVGVLGRGLDRLADGRAVEEPTEADGDERHHDEDGELRPGDPDVRDLVGRRRSGRGTGRRGRRSRGATPGWRARAGRCRSWPRARSPGAR